MRRTLPLPLGLIGALGLIALAESAIKRVDIYLMTPDQAIAQATAKHLPKWSRGQELLVFGDSQAKQTIAPRELGGTPGYNLALAGSQAANSYYLLKRVIASGAKPELVIVDFFPPLQRLPHWHVVENDPYLLSVGEAFDLAVEARDPAFFASILARKTFASFRLRHSIRTLALNRIKQEGPTDWASASHVLIRNHQANHGAQIHLTTPITSERVERLNADYFPRWEVWALQERYIERFLQLADRERLNVAWLLSPFHPKLQALTEASGFDAAWSDYVAGWIRRHPNLRVIDGRGLRYPDDHFVDPNHLAKPGIAAFNSALAAQLPESAKATASGRWLRLKPVGPQTTASTLEDVKTTAQAIRERTRAEWVASKRVSVPRQRYV